jgi:hypothetical protein
MSDYEPRSEVARLREHIRLEYEAAERGLCGISQGAARHAFITKKLENIVAHLNILKHLVGEQETAKVLVEALSNREDDEQIRYTPWIDASKHSTQIQKL